MPIKTDNELMAQFRECSVEAFMQIFTRYQRKLYNFSLGITKDYDSSQDVVQSTMLKVYDYKLRYESSHEFSTWIYTITKNLSINELKRAGRFDAFDQDNEENTSFDKDLSSDYLRQKISDLPAMYIDIIISRYIDGFSFKEISEITGININTLKSHAKRGLEILKKMIEDDDDEKKNV